VNGDLIFGSFVTPTVSPPLHAVEMAVHSEQAGLDLVTFQDHPYQPSFHDTWTLLSFAAARTSRIHLAGNVLNIPLRRPSVLARSAASLDILSGGRVEMGIGAGGFWDAIVGMGGERLTPGQSIQALEEAVAIMRGIWATDVRGGVRVDGEFHQVKGAKRGPAPAHDIGIWIGAYKPRILRTTGRIADGWLPSLPYLPDGPASLEEMNRHIDEGAHAAGRDPSAVRRLLNIGGKFSAQGGGLLDGPPAQWAEQLAEISLTYGITGFILTADDATTLQVFAGDVVPAVRELVAAEGVSAEG
jgi:alkanesulfonate monooxygenase SsuD/methylene tetrahydromethanopterin reductase-like flavin-dependent oxidoreductase (luciferase family)